MADLDPSNPVAIIIAFFGIMVIAFALLFRVVQGLIYGGILGGLTIGAIGFFGFFKIFAEK